MFRLVVAYIFEFTNRCYFRIIGFLYHYKTKFHIFYEYTVILRKAHLEMDVIENSQAHLLTLMKIFTVIICIALLGETVKQ